MTGAAEREGNRPVPRGHSETITVDGQADLMNSPPSGGEVRAVVSTCFSRDPHPCRRLFVVLGAEHTGDAISNLTNQGHPDISPGRSSGLAPGRTRPFEPVKHHPLRVECLLVRDRGGPEGTRARPRTEVPAGSGQLLEAGQHA